jgi:hemoglobin/transferrin/lactoferrin receptor protein
VRIDSHRLDADATDAVYLSGNPGTPPPVSMTDTAVSPKLGVVYHWTEAWTVFGQYARGFRAPPYSDVNNGFANLAFGYRTLSNPELRPETSDNYEAGVRAAFARGSLSVSVFDNHFDDFIETVVVSVSPDGFIEFQPQNVEKVEIYGAELAADHALGRGWSLRGAASFTRGTNATTSQPLESIAPPQVVAGGAYRAADGRWRTELTATYVTEKDADDLPADSTQFRTPAYLLLDLFGTVQLARPLSLQVGVYNLTDETYWTWGDVRGRQAGSAGIDRYTSPGRSVAANLRFTY